MKIGRTQCPKWTEECLLQRQPISASHGHARISKSTLVLQRKYSTSATRGLQQQPNGIQPVSGNKLLPMNPNVGKVTHQNDGMIISNHLPTIISRCHGAWMVIPGKCMCTVLQHLWLLYPPCPYRIERTRTGEKKRRSFEILFLAIFKLDFENEFSRFGNSGKMNVLLAIYCNIKETLELQISAIFANSTS